MPITITTADGFAAYAARCRTQYVADLAGHSWSAALAELPSARGPVVRCVKDGLTRAAFQAGVPLPKLTATLRRDDHGVRSGVGITARFLDGSELVIS